MPATRVFIGREWFSQDPCKKAIRRTRNTHKSLSDLHMLSSRIFRIFQPSGKNHRNFLTWRRVFAFGAAKQGSESPFKILPWLLSSAALSETCRFFRGVSKILVNVLCRTARTRGISKFWFKSILGNPCAFRNTQSHMTLQDWQPLEEDPSAKVDLRLRLRQQRLFKGSSVPKFKFNPIGNNNHVDFTQFHYLEV